MPSQCPFFYGVSFSDNYALQILQTQKVRGPHVEKVTLTSHDDNWTLKSIHVHASFFECYCFQNIWQWISLWRGEFQEIFKNNMVDSGSCGASGSLKFTVWQRGAALFERECSVAFSSFGEYATTTESRNGRFRNDIASIFVHKETREIYKTNTDTDFNIANDTVLHRYRKYKRTINKTQKTIRNYSPRNLSHFIQMCRTLFTELFFCFWPSICIWFELLEYVTSIWKELVENKCYV